MTMLPLKGGAMGRDISIRLLQFIERIEHHNSDIAQSRLAIKQVEKEAIDAGLSASVIKKCIRSRTDIEQDYEFEYSIFEMYMAAIKLAVDNK